MDNELAGRTFFIRTFGCQMNENDSRHIALLLESAGAEAATGQDDADIIIINTCAVRKKSEDKLYSFLGRLGALKAAKPIVIGVIGCVAQVYGNGIIERAGSVDFVAGPGEYPELVGMIAGAAGGPCVRTGLHSGWRETSPASGGRTAPGPSEFVTVMEGCNNFCSYCIVPFSRGREKSRPTELIMEEVRDLTRSGVKEIQLLGQNVNSWRDPATGHGLDWLLDEVGAVPEVEWVRFITSHPRNFGQDLIQAVKRNGKVCRQIHLPLQSGSTAVLKAMNRGYTAEEYLELAGAIKAEIPGMVLGTDIIVGFPGETESDFQATCDMLEKIRFASIFSFRYSPRPRTAAAAMDDPVPLTEKRRRLIVLQDLQKSLQTEINRTFIGRTCRVLCTGRSPKGDGRYAGRTTENMVVNFDSDRDPRGDFALVDITDCGPYSLRGREAA